METEFRKKNDSVKKKKIGALEFWQVFLAQKSCEKMSINMWIKTLAMDERRKARRLIPFFQP